MHALVTDAQNLISLAVSRSLGRAGIRVTSLADQGLPFWQIPTAWSRHSSLGRIPSPKPDPARYRQEIRRLMGPGTVFVPVLLASMLEAAALTGEDPDFPTLVSHPTTLSRLDQTDQLLKRARTLEIPTPRTFHSSPGSDPDPLAWPDLTFPAIVKYRQGDVLGFQAHDRYRIVHHPQELAREYARMHSLQPYPLVQEYVKGPGYGFSALYDREGRLTAGFCHRRIREYPLSGGPSALAESVWEDRLFEYGTRLLEDAGLVGVGMVEFKQDLASGEFKLMEVNPRFWGSLPLSIMSGIDFPLLYYRVARGEKVEPQLTYRLGTRMRYLPKDLGAMWQMLQGAREDRLRILTQLVRELVDPAVGEALFQLADPMPALLYLLGRLRGAIG